MPNRFSKHLHIKLSILLWLPVWDCLVQASTKSNRFYQLIFPFSEKKTYKYYYDKKGNFIVLNILNAKSEDLKAIDYYDEAIIRRILIRETQGEGVSLRLYLKDANVRAMVTDFKEPFRIVIDLFDNYFKENRDSNTGMPFIAMRGLSSPPPKDGYRVPDKSSMASPDIQRDQKSPLEPKPSSRESSPTVSDKKHRLLQPIPQEIVTSEDMTKTLAKIGAGPGTFWQRYPVYIYRLQTGAYKIDKNYQTWLNKHTKSAMSSYEAMAKYAGDLFDFGHEGRSLIAYQQVLHKAPIIFDKNALHLWKLAEIHFGQGNQILAAGYYEALKEKHPDSSLSKYATLRLLDIKAIDHLNKDKANKLPKLATELERIWENNPELMAQIGIRKAYWSEKAKDIVRHIGKKRYHIPQIDVETRISLEKSYKRSEGPFTAFLVSSIILNDRLKDFKDWEAQTGVMLERYFKRFRGPKVEPIVSQIRARTRIVVNKLIQDIVFNRKDYLHAIKTYDKLPKIIRYIRENDRTTWAIAQAYRLIGQPEKALPFYKLAANNTKIMRDKFKAQFWGAISGIEALNSKHFGENNRIRSNKLQNEIRRLDQQMETTWNKLSPKDRREIYVGMKEPLEETISSPTLIRSGPIIMLNAWKTALNQKSASDNETVIKKAYVPNAKTVYILTELADRFNKLGLKKERDETNSLIPKLQPAMFKDDDRAVKYWAEKLVQIAEEHRQKNNYLQAGQLYSLSGKKSGNWDRRAEALYKGGLLLFRAGRRKEALESFTLASEDGNNLLYAELAKKRLDQLQQ